MSNKQKGKESFSNSFFDICIIGGGASGMAAAISAKEVNSAMRVCIVEKKEEVGKKLLATGNGRCNIANSYCDEFGVVSEFLKKNGIIIKEEAEGRMYPYSEQASAVLQLLKNRIEKLNITTFTNSNVIKIESQKNPKNLIFNISMEAPKEPVALSCNKVIIACGGKAAPQFGTSGDGYSIAKKFGHTVSRVYPVLMPLECTGITKELKGTRAKAQASLLKGENLIAEESGELQFTEYGLSGICIFNLTRHITFNIERAPAEKDFRQYSIEVDFLPHMDKFQIVEELRERQVEIAELSAELFLASMVSLKLGEEILKDVLGRINPKITIGDIAPKDIEEIARHLKSSRYTVTGGRGWKEAQCTGGGVDLKEINLDTMESKLQKNVYFSGEILDFDGPCGGYNLNNAWFTGIKAGRGAAEELTQSAVIGE